MKRIIFILTVLQCFYAYADDLQSELRVESFNQQEIEIKSIIYKLEDNESDLRFLNTETANATSSTSNPADYIKTINVHISNDVFWPMYHYKTPILGTKIYEINGSKVSDFFGYHPVAPGTKLDGDIYYTARSTDDYDRTNFVVDPSRRRFGYSTEYDDGTFTDIYYYGDNPGDFHFSGIRAFDVNTEGEIFIIDADKKVYKFLFNPSTMNITSVPSNATQSYFDENFISDPSDIEYNDFCTYDNLSDDLIYIADKGRKSITVFNPDGSLYKELTSYYLSRLDTHFEFKSPTLVRTGVSAIHTLPFPGVHTFLAVYDEGYHAIFIGMNLIDDLESNYIEGGLCFEISRLPLNSIVTDIGYTASGTYIVSDDRSNLIHVFNYYGEYLCSYDGKYFPQEFESPQHLSNFVYSFPFEGYRIIDFYIWDRYNESTGLKRFIPGVDVVNTLLHKSGTIYRLQWIFTGACDYKVELIRVEDNYILQTETGEHMIGGNTELVSVLTDILSPGELYKWKISYLSRYDDFYSDLSRGWQSRELEFEYFALLPVVINSNMSIGPGLYIADNNVTISNDAILTVNPGATVLSAPGKKITVDYGSKIVANGTETYPIAFKSSGSDKWGGLILNSQNNEFENCEFENADKAVNMMFNNNTFTNCNFSGNNYGLYGTTAVGFTADNCTFSSNAVYGVDLDGISNSSYNKVTIKNSVFDGNQIHMTIDDIPDLVIADCIMKDGIIAADLNNCSGVFSGNSVFNNAGAVYADDGCFFEFTDDYLKATAGNNHIYNNGDGGITCSFGSSWLLLTDEWYDDCSNNSIYSNSGICVEAGGNSEVEAAHNYWGGYPVDNAWFIENNGWIDYSDPLSSDPFGEGSAPLAKPSEMMTLNTVGTELIISDNKTDRYKYIREMLEVYKADLRRSRSVTDKKKLLNRIHLLSKKLEDQSYEAFLERLISQDKRQLNSALKSTLISLKAKLLADQNKDEEALTSNRELLARFSKDRQVIRDAWHRIFKLCYRDEERKDQAEEALNSLIDLAESDLDWRMVEKLYFRLHGTKDGLNLAKRGQKQQAEGDVITVFDLSAAYPNPFNPTTKIRLTLPQGSQVKLEVYNITGQRVATLIDGYRSAGSHEVVFDGSRLASGVYFYRMVTPQFTAIKRMLLIK